MFSTCHRGDCSLFVSGSLERNGSLIAEVDDQTMRLIGFSSMVLGTGLLYLIN